MGREWNDWASLPLRLILGFGFAYHGYPKLFGGHDGFAGMLTNLGIPAPGPMAWLVGLLAPDAATPNELGNYVRVWRNLPSTGRIWRVAVDLMSPLPPTSEAQEQ